MGGYCGIPSLGIHVVDQERTRLVGDLSLLESALYVPFTDSLAMLRPFNVL